MAETKSRGSSSGAKAKSKRAKPRKTNASKSSASKGASKKRQVKQGSSNGSGQIGSARTAVESTAKQAGSTVSEAGRSVGRAAQKAKTPLLAGGAAVAGAAGGLALGTRQARKSKLRRPKLKIRSKDLAKAARNAGQLGMEVGEIATELRRNREQTNGSNRRSPVEVVLDGLTHRGGDS